MTLENLAYLLVLIIGFSQHFTAYQHQALFDIYLSHDNNFIITKGSQREGRSADVGPPIPPEFNF